MAAATSRSSAARSSPVEDGRLLASRTSPDRHSRTTHSTSGPTSGCRPSSARIARPCPARTARSRSSSSREVATSSSPRSGSARRRAGSAVGQVGHGTLARRHAALQQGAMDLRHAAVLAVAERPDQGDDVEAELVPRQHGRALGLRPVGPAVARAARVLATPDPQPQADQAGERGHRVPVVVAVAQPAAAGRAMPVSRLEHLLATRLRARRGPGHGRSPPSRPFGRSTASQLCRPRKKRRRDRLIGLARGRPGWAFGFADEVWFSRLAQPALHAWTAGEPLRLGMHAAGRDDPEPKALACYGLWLPERERMLLRFVAGRPISGVTCAFLAWVAGRLAAEGVRVLLLIWDNAPWHVSREVRAWIAAHNRRVKRDGGCRLLVCRLPSKSPWLNPIEPKWVHGKRAVVEADRKLTAEELQQRLCDHYRCPLAEPLAQQAA